MLNSLLCHPTVCAVGNQYHIMIPTNCEALVSVRIGQQEYFHHSNGILVSMTPVHRIVVPMEVLDSEKKYTVICRKVLDRRPYFPEMADPIEERYDFRPVEKLEHIHIYQIADCHGHIEEAVRAGSYFGKGLDILILNGDIADSSSDLEHCMTCYHIASKITEGRIPCVISRGNHDLRGRYAEKLADYMPNDNGRQYYTFRLGCVWGIVLDCGEDKGDQHPEYGGTIACHIFRQEETLFLRKVIQEKGSEYEAPGITHKLVISHVPFAHTMEAPFNIEDDIYTEWCRLLKEQVHPDLMLCGHLHKLAVSREDSEYDQKGQPCPVIIGSDIRKKDDGTTVFTGLALQLCAEAKVFMNNSEGKVELEDCIHKHNYQDC